MRWDWGIRIPQQNNFDQTEYFYIAGLIPLEMITDLLLNSVGARLGWCVVVTNKDNYFFSVIRGV